MEGVNKSSRSTCFICLFLVIATLAVYWQVSNHEFLNYDDDLYITQNYHVQAGLRLSGLFWSFTSGTLVSNYWHPLTWLSHMMDVQLYGMNAGGHHMTNLILHIANTLLVFFLLNRMTKDIWKSAFASSLFALHPLHVESVAWVAERKDVLSTLFWLLTMLAYCRFVEKATLTRYFMLVLCFVLGLMSKPMLVTLPFVLLLLDLWPLNRLQLGQEIHVGSVHAQSRSIWFLIGEKVPLFVMAAGASIAAYITQKIGGALPAMDGAVFKIQIANALVSYASYIQKMIWPTRLAAFYPHPGTVPLPMAVGAGVLLIIITACVVFFWRRRPYLLVGWFWFVGTLVPVIGLVKVGSFAMADRYTYVPLIGLFILVAWLVPDLVPLRSHRKVWFATIAMLYLSVLMGLTWKQTRYWKDSATLFTHALTVTTDNYLAHMKLGEALAEQHNNAEAIQHYLEALRINPDFALVLFNLGNVYADLGSIDDAVYYYKKALQKQPNFAKAHNNLGNAMARQGNYEAAAFHYKEAIRINPGYAGAYYNLARIAANQGQIEDAILHYQKTVLLNPMMTEALFNLSWIYATHPNEQFRNAAEALRLAEKLCKMTQYNQPLALDALAAAHAETGQFDAAVATAKKALQLALKYGPEELVLDLKKRLQLYQTGHPYRHNFR